MFPVFREDKQERTNEMIVLLALGIALLIVAAMVAITEVEG
jgi:hypothetical protein